MSILKDEYRTGNTPAPQTFGKQGTPSSGMLKTNLPKVGENREPFLLRVGKDIVNEALRYPKLIGAGLIQAPVAALTQGRVNIPIMSDEELSRYDRTQEGGIGRVALSGARDIASGASFVVGGGGIAGAGAKSVAKTVALESTAGLLSGLADDEATPESVALSTAAGGVIGTAAPVAVRGITKLAGGVLRKIGGEAAETVVETGARFSDIPEEINYKFYKRIPSSMKETLKIAGEETEKLLKSGETIPMPNALKVKIDQIRNGGSSLSKSFDKFVKTTVEDVAQVPARTGFRGAVDSFTRGIDAAKKNFLEQASTVLEKQGNSGRALSTLMREIRDTSERRTGQSLVQLRQVLGNLTNSQKDELVEVLDKGALTADETVKSTAQQVRKMLDSIINEARELGVDQTEIRGITRSKKAVQKLDNYFPHIFDPSQFNQVDRRNEIIKSLVKAGSAADEGEAAKILDNFIRKNAPRRFGSLEFGRIAGVDGWERDPLKALSTYMDRAYRRLEEVKRFGQNNQNAQILIRKIAEEGGDGDFAQKIFNRVHGPAEGGTLVTQDFKSEVLDKAGSFQVITKLGLGQITNLGQTFNTVVKFGVEPTFKAIREAFTEGGEEFAVRSGAVLDSTLREITEGRGGGSAATKFLKATGFTASEKFNRIVAANAGKNAAENEFAKLIRNQGNIQSRRMLEEMGINVKAAINRGSLNADDLAKAGQKASDWTQFRVGAIDVPLFWSTPEGRVLVQFKNFAFKHTQFIRDAVIKEALVHKNFKPLVRLILFSQLIGEPLADLKEAVRGKDVTRKDLSIPERMWENFATLGGIGIFWDLWQSARLGKIPDLLLGPTVGDFSSVLEAGSQAATGNVKPLGKETVRRIPIVGPAAKNILFQDQKSTKGTPLTPLPPIR